MSRPPRRQRGSRSPLRVAAALAATLVLAACTGTPPTEAPVTTSPPSSTAQPTRPSSPGAPSPTSTPTPDFAADLAGFASLWKPDHPGTFVGTVENASALEWNDRLASWINAHATRTERFRALQNAAYLATDGGGYDMSISIADGLGAKLGVIYAQGRIHGDLPLTSALINSSDGTAGAYALIGSVKSTLSYPRPYVRTDPGDAPVPGDNPACAPKLVNASSLAANREGKPWASASGDLLVTRVPSATDTTHEFATTDVQLGAGYSAAVLCKGGSFPSGHATTAYEAGITLATLLPELAPQILARASEAANNRIVLGLHYPLDIIGGRISGEAALAARWSDPAFRTDILEPARAELVGYLEKECGNTVAACAAAGTPYTNNPYGGAKLPGGTSQVVRDRASAIAVYTERLSYGFAPTRAARQPASVPTGAESLLLSTFPTLTDPQRTSVLAQTEIGSGNPLDTTASNLAGVGPGSWQRLNLAAAMSATVQVAADGSVRVTGTGGAPKVVTS